MILTRNHIFLEKPLPRLVCVVTFPPLLRSGAWAIPIHTRGNGRPGTPPPSSSAGRLHAGAYDGMPLCDDGLEPSVKAERDPRRVADSIFLARASSGDGSRKHHHLSLKELSLAHPSHHALDAHSRMTIEDARTILLTTRYPDGTRYRARGP
ncbi:hypothetical protein DFH09DRAFT_1304296 [Mycena vulgaris]|nr:hypothetical protein DFH09DRAFT_1304296 [Mycena vulgaris]